VRAVVQRVTEASVSVDGEVVGSCGQGFVALVAAHRDDTTAEAVKLADRVWGMRVFSDAEGKMNLALRDLPKDRRIGVLAISNFTLYGDPSKNRRPSFVQSAPFDQGKELFERFVTELQNLGCEVETGVFGAHMTVDSVSDGPVTLIVDVPPAEAEGSSAQ
jgi:D-tyrosyl-tRNA(Tyr) deacylase